MAKVFMGIGIPGAGKTTFLKSFAQSEGYAYLCPDDIRAELLGDARTQSNQKLVWDTAYERLAQLLESGRSVVFDATFIDANGRRKAAQKMRTLGAAEIAGIYFDVSIDEARQRNEQREKVVPPEVINEYYARLTASPPQMGDGFDELYTYDETHTLRKMEEVNEARTEYRMHRFQ